MESPNWPNKTVFVGDNLHVDMSLRHQLPISEIFSVDNAVQRITENMGIVAVIETPFQFLKVSVQVLPAHLVEGSDNRTLEQAPHALYPVGVDLSCHPFLSGVAHSLMPCVVIFNPHVGLQLIGVNRLSLILNGSMDEIMESVALDIGNALDSNLTAIPLDGTGDPSLVALVCMTLAFGAATYQCLIHFHDPEESGSGEGVVSHRLSDAVAKIPGCLVRDSQSAVKLVRAHTLLGFAHEIDSSKPLSQGQVGVVHDGSRGHAEMIAASLAVPLSASLDSSDRCITTPDTGNPIRPAQAFQMLAAFVIIVETIKQREDIHESNP